MAGTTRPVSSMRVTFIQAAAPPYALTTLETSVSRSEAKAAEGRRRAARMAARFMAPILPSRCTPAPAAADDEHRAVVLRVDPPVAADRQRRVRGAERGIEKGTLPERAV